MTNEQLAFFIQQGDNDELIPILWGNVRKLLYAFSDRYYRAYSDSLTQCGITAWDLKQHAYSAFLKAIEGYDDSKGCKFTSYLHYPFKNAIRELRTKDLLNKSDSLNIPVNSEHEDIEVIDLVADEHSLDFVEQVEQSDETEQVKKVIHIALDKLPENESDVIKERFFNNRTYADIAADKGKSIERIRQIINNALSSLRKNRDIYRLGQELGYTSSSAYNNSLSGFKHTGLSNVERIAIARADIEEQQKRREVVCKEYKLLFSQYNSGLITIDELYTRMYELEESIYSG